MKDNKDAKHSSGDPPVASDTSSQADDVSEPANPPAASARPRGRAIGADVQAYIGRQLRAVYDDVALQPVPERFLDLMKQLETRTAES